MPDDDVANRGDSWYIAVATDQSGLAQKLKQIGRISSFPVIYNDIDDNFPSGLPAILSS